MHRIVAVVVGLLFVAVSLPASGQPDPTPPARLSAAVISELKVGNVGPTWGAQIPKVVYDGSWFYATTLDGDGSQYPWQAHIWKSRNGRNWTEAALLPGHVYQPPGLLVDGAGRLHVQVACWTGGQCFPGVAPKPGGELESVYAVRLVFTHRLPDGSVDFGRYDDHSVRTGVTERYYQGMAVDPTGRYIYSAYAIAGWDLYFNVFDTWTGTDVHTTKLGSPPAGRAWLYFRVQPGIRPGEVFLSFEQYVLGTPNSLVIDAALLWKSDDQGRTFGERRVLASEPNPDGVRSWVDPSDITVDSGGEVHAIFFKATDGVERLYYQEGMDGTPVALGPFNEHSQLVVRDSGERLIFTTVGTTLAESPAELTVVRSDDGRAWETTQYPIGITGVRVFWPNLLQERSGSRVPPGWDSAGYLRQGMLLSGYQGEGLPFSPLLFVTYMRTDL